MLREFPLPSGFNLNVEHEIELRAEGSTLTVGLDRQTLGSVTDAVFKSGLFGVVVGGPITKPVLIKSLEVLNTGTFAAVSPSPNPFAAASSTKFPPGQWVDVLQEYFARPAEQRRQTFIEPSPEGWKVAERRSFQITLGEKQNVALRATVRGIKETLTLVVRASGSDAAKNMRNYQAWLKPDGSVVIVRKDQTQPASDIELSHSAPIPGFSPAASHTFEFRAVDDVLTTTVDGRVLEAVRDASNTKGSLAFVGNAGMIVEKLELSDLTGLKSAAAAVASAAATKDAPFVNSLGMKFVPVPIVGRRSSPPGGQDGRPTTVLFSVWDTRVRDYAAYAQAEEAAGRKVDGAWKTAQKDGEPVGREPDHPVVSVSWEDAQRFCAWLTEKEHAEGKLAQELCYRLPTDHEWSCAVGIGDQEDAAKLPSEKSQKLVGVYPWGAGWPPKGKPVGNYADESLHAKFPPKQNEKENRMENEKWLEGYDDGYATTSPVGSFPANADGLYDLGGNVWQWCEDWFDDKQEHRVLRGASWTVSDHGGLLSSARYHNTPGNRNYINGFRCVVAMSAPAASSSPSSQSPPSSPAPAPAKQILAAPGAK